MNLRLAELEPAIRDYEAAIASAREPDLVALARFGLAVARERLGDLPLAFAALDLANAVRLPTPPYPTADPLDLPGVFFVPPYDEHYLRALRAMAIARRAAGTFRREAYEAADAAWGAYLEEAPQSVPFRENARLHRMRCARELETLAR